MLGKFIGAAGVLIALAGLVYLIRLLILKFTGVPTEVEVVLARETKPNVYTHTLRFPDGMEREDKAGFNQPFPVGMKVKVICDPKNSGKFEYEQQLGKNIIIVCALIVMAILFAFRGFAL